MLPNKEAKIIFSLVIISAILFVSAIFTINGTFAIDKDNNNSRWDIYFSGVDIRSNTTAKVDIVSNIINISDYNLKENSEVSFITKIKNEGTYDAILEKFIITDLSEIEVGTSSLGNTYTLADFIKVEIINASTNLANGIEVDTIAQKGDLLHKETENIVYIKISSLDKAELASDMQEVLDNNENKIKTNISISALYQQKK